MMVITTFQHGEAYDSYIPIHQSLLSHKLVYNGDFQALNCRYSFRIQLVLLKFCVALVTRYDLLSLQKFGFTAIIHQLPSCYVLTASKIGLYWCMLDNDCHTKSLVTLYICAFSTALQLQPSSSLKLRELAKDELLASLILPLEKDDTEDIIEEIDADESPSLQEYNEKRQLNERK